MSTENPRGVYDLSRARYEEALHRVESGARGDPVPEGTDLLNELRIVRLVGLHRVPWWGMVIDPDDSSVDVGVVLSSAFEALGEDHWFTRRNRPRWRRGKKEYLEWLDVLGLDRPPD